MSIFKKLALSGAAAMGLCAGAAQAQVVTLTFEGIANNTAVGNYYNGGAGGNLGVQFSPATLALVDSDAGGGGNFANEPSANTIMFFLDADNAILNYSAGFSTGFSFFYTSSTAAPVTVWSGLNGTGTLLGTINLVAQHTQNCSGDPNGTFCNWTAAGVAFAGTARSINFGGTANQTGYDNITFGAATPTGAVPEPATWAMMIAGFGVIGSSMRRRTQTKISFA